MHAFDQVLANILAKAERWVSQAMLQLPYLESLALDMLDAAFAPRQILKQLAMIFALQITLILSNGVYANFQTIRNLVTSAGKKEKQLLELLARANSYTEWKHIAVLLDEARGLDKWRSEEECSLYDAQVIRKRIASTVDMLTRGDVFDLMFRLRGGLSRDQFGMQHEGLYSRALAGSKLLVERYHETMAAALNFICDSPISDEEIPTDANLSGGAYLGYYHLGVVKALFEEGLLPRVISGASAGSIMT
eukprot:gene39519-48115_t